MDFIIGDKIVTPEKRAESFTEEVALLENCYLCFCPPDFELAISPTPALSNNYITFGCFNNSNKVNDRVISIWSKILLTVKKSKLLFKGNTYVNNKIERIAKEFALNEVNLDQLVFEGPCSRKELLTSYNSVDIALDPFPFPGGTTTCEALWMGVPTVTMRGNTFLSSVGETIAVNSGHAELCAANTNEYIKLAVTMADDAMSLNTNRIQRRSKIIKTPLFDGQSFARNFELLTKTMLEKSCSNE
jgi:predicted O-linked N-acetylglucosamine transferase (SPINDLY family)